MKKVACPLFLPYMIADGMNGAYLFLLWASIFLLVCVVGSIGPLALVGIVMLGAFLQSFFSQFINWSLSDSQDPFHFKLDSKAIATGIIGIVAAITLGAGLLALSLAAVPFAAFVTASIIIYATAGLCDFMLFWSMNDDVINRERLLYV